MTDGTRDNGEKTDKAADRSINNLPTDEAALSARLSRLDHRLSEIRKERGDQADQSASESQDRSAKASAMARGFRLSSELIAGVFVGSAIGWGIDRWLSTSPWGLMVFMLLGFAAGVINVMRAAGVAQGDGSPSSGPKATTRRDNARDQ